MRSVELRTRGFLVAAILLLSVPVGAQTGPIVIHDNPSIRQRLAACATLACCVAQADHLGDFRPDVYRIGYQ